MFAGLAKIIFASYSNLEHYLHPQSDAAADPANDVEYKSGQAAPVVHRRYPTTEMNYIQWQPEDRIYYNKDEEEERLEETEKQVVGTKIISASVGERRAEKVPLKEPVIYTLEHKSVINFRGSGWAYTMTATNHDEHKVYYDSHSNENVKN